MTKAQYKLYKELEIVYNESGRAFEVANRREAYEIQLEVLTAHLSKCNSQIQYIPQPPRISHDELCSSLLGITMSREADLYDERFNTWYVRKEATCPKCGKNSLVVKEFPSGYIVCNCMDKDCNSNNIPLKINLRDADDYFVREQDERPE